MASYSGVGEGLSPVGSKRYRNLWEVEQDLESIRSLLAGLEAIRDEAKMVRSETGESMEQAQWQQLNKTIRDCHRNLKHLHKTKRRLLREGKRQ